MTLVQRLLLKRCGPVGLSPCEGRQQITPCSERELSAYLAPGHHTPALPELSLVRSKGPEFQGTLGFRTLNVPSSGSQMAPPEQRAPREVFEFIALGRYILCVLNTFSIFHTGLQQIHNS